MATRGNGRSAASAFLEESDIIQGVFCIPFTPDDEDHVGIVATIDNPGVFQQPTFAKIAAHSTKGKAQVQLAAILSQVAKIVKGRLVIEIVQGSNSKEYGPFKPFMKDKISDVIRDRAKELGIVPTLGKNVRDRHGKKSRSGKASPQKRQRLEESSGSDAGEELPIPDPLHVPGEPPVYLTEEELSARDAARRRRKKGKGCNPNRKKHASQSDDGKLSGGKKRKRTRSPQQKDDGYEEEGEEEEQANQRSPKKQKHTSSDSEDDMGGLQELLDQVGKGAGRQGKVVRQDIPPVTREQLEEFYAFCDKIDPANGTNNTIAAYRVCLYVPSQVGTELLEVQDSFGLVLAANRTEAEAEAGKRRRRGPPPAAHEAYKHIFTPSDLMAATSRAYGVACSAEELRTVMRTNSFASDKGKGNPLVMYSPRADNPNKRYDKNQCDKTRQFKGLCYYPKNMFEISLPMYSHKDGINKLLETPLPDLRYDTVLHPFIQKYVDQAMTNRSRTVMSPERLQKLEATYMASFGAPPCFGYSGMSFDAKAKNTPILSRINEAKEQVMKESDVPEALRKTVLWCLDVRHRIRVAEAHLAAITARVPEYASPTQLANHDFILRHREENNDSLSHPRPKTFRGSAATCYFLATGLLRRETNKLSTWHNNSVLLDLAGMSAFNHWSLGISVLQLGKQGLGKSKCQDVLKEGLPKGLHDNAGRRTRFLNSAPGNYDSDIHIIDEKPEAELGYMKNQYGGKETPEATMNKARLTNETREDVTLSLKFDDDGNRLRDKLVQKNGHIEIASSNIAAEFMLGSMLDRYHVQHFTAENAEIPSDFIRIIAARVEANMDSKSHNNFRQWLFAMVCHAFFLMTVDYGLPPVKTPVCDRYLGDLLVECESRGLPDTTNARAIGRVISLVHVCVVVRQVLTHFNFASSSLSKAPYQVWQWQKLAPGMCDTLADFTEAVGFLATRWEKPQTCRVLRAWFELSFRKSGVSAADAEAARNRAAASGSPFGSSSSSSSSSSQGFLGAFPSASVISIENAQQATNEDEEVDAQMARSDIASANGSRDTTLGWGTNRTSNPGTSLASGPRVQHIVQNSRSLHTPQRVGTVGASRAQTAEHIATGSLVTTLPDAVDIAQRRETVKAYRNKFVLAHDKGSRTGLDIPRSNQAFGQSIVNLVDLASAGLHLREDTLPSSSSSSSGPSSSSSSRMDTSLLSDDSLLPGHQEISWFKKPLLPNENGQIPIPQTAMDEVERRCRQMNSDLDALDDLQTNMQPLVVNANGVPVFTEMRKQSQIAGRICKKLNLPFNLIMDILRAQTGEHAVTLYRNNKPVTIWQRNISWASDLNKGETSVHPNVFRFNTSNIMLSALQSVLEKDKRLRPMSFSFGTDRENPTLRAYPYISPDLSMEKIVRSRHVHTVAETQRKHTQFSKQLTARVLEGIRGEVVSTDEYWQKQVPGFDQLHPADALWHLHIAKQCIPLGQEEEFGALHPDVTSRVEDKCLADLRIKWIHKEYKDACALGETDLLTALRKLRHERLAGRRPMVATRLLSYEHLDKQDPYLFPRQLIKCMGNRGLLN